MKTKSGHLSIAEICDQLESATLVANKQYQRAAGIWPPQAKSYFIDTIISDFPFQSIYLHEYYNKNAKKIRKDIVDGQQRLTTIKEFKDDKFALSKTAKKYAGKKFSELADEVQEFFLAYSVPVITISLASQAEILEMFRRMNSFTVPLNEAEKRHSDFHGEFKWFVNGIADAYSPVFNAFGVLTEKQIVRMADAELIADIADVVDRGIENRQPAILKKLYKKFDQKFENKDDYQKIFSETFSFIRDELGEINNTFMCKSYAFHSLASALIHNKWGIPNGENVLGAAPSGRFVANRDAAVQNILALAGAHEASEKEGSLAAYVEACESTTHRKHQRTVRTKYLLNALNNTLD